MDVSVVDMRGRGDISSLSPIKRIISRAPLTPHTTRPTGHLQASLCLLVIYCISYTLSLYNCLLSSLC
jgi:hypothetical protein